MLTDKQVSLSDIRYNKSINLLDQAEVLLNNHMYDGSINRSYYSIFYAIRSILALLDKDSSKHSGVISLFDKHLVKTEIISKKYSKIAHTSFDLRQDSDYDDFFYPRLEEATGQVKNAKLFVKEIDQIRQQILIGQIELPS